MTGLIIGIAVLILVGIIWTIIEERTNKEVDNWEYCPEHTGNCTHGHKTDKNPHYIRKRKDSLRHGRVLVLNDENFDEEELENYRESLQVDDTIPNEPPSELFSPAEKIKPVEASNDSIGYPLSNSSSFRDSPSYERSSGPIFSTSSDNSSDD